MHDGGDKTGAQGPAVAPIDGETLHAAAFAESAGLRLRLWGAADMVDVPLLQSFLEAVAAEVRRARHGEVTVELEDLEFMNSSSIKCVLTWVMQVQNGPPGERYRVRFLSNPTHHWQKRTLPVVVVLAPDVAIVESR